MLRWMIIALQAVNGSTIRSYGSKVIKVRLDCKVFEHTMVIASVPTPILGFDFLAKFKLDLIWTHGQCALFSGKNKSTYPLTSGSAPKSHLSLEPISFKQYLAAQKTPPSQVPMPSA